jgi:hypothetical protein
MDVSPTEQDTILRDRIRIQDSGQFEQLVFELAHREFPDVRRIGAPDAGADTLRPSTPERAAEVWQAKHHTAGINWTECRKSLVAAVDRWSPSRIIFAFPVDLSQGPEKTFQTELVEHPTAVKHGVSIEQWNLSELIRRLAQNPDLRNRFFPETESFREQVVRGVSAGGELQSGNDLVERARTISEYAQQRDLNFSYKVLTSEVDEGGPAPQWPEPPYLQVKVSDGRNEVELMAWPRESATVEAPSFSFKTDQEGQAARAAAMRAWARGEQATVTSGAQLRFVKPELVDEILAGTSIGEGGTIYMAAPEPFDAVLEITSPDDEKREFTFPARVVPPPEGAIGAFVGYIDDVFIEVTVVPLDDGRARATFNLSAELGQSASKSLAAAELMVLWAEQKRVGLRTSQMYQEGIGGTATRGVEDDLVDEMKGRRDLYRDLQYIEEQLAIELPMPTAISHEDVINIHGIADVLRTGKGTSVFHNISVHDVNPAEIPRLVDDFAAGGPVRRPVDYPIFGRSIVIGEGDYVLPKLKIVDIIAHGQRATDPARVVIGADGDDQMSFTLVK